VAGWLVFPVHETGIRGPWQVGDLLDMLAKITEKVANPSVGITLLFLRVTVGPVRMTKKEIRRRGEGRRIPLMHAASFQPPGGIMERRGDQYYTHRSRSCRYPNRAKKVTFFTTALGVSWDSSMYFSTVLRVILLACRGEPRR
jgi:hypothetical protein